MLDDLVGDVVGFNKEEVDDVPVMMACIFSCLGKDDPHTSQQSPPWLLLKVHIMQVTSAAIGVVAAVVEDGEGGSGCDDFLDSKDPHTSQQSPLWVFSNVQISQATTNTFLVVKVLLTATGSFKETDEGDLAPRLFVIDPDKIRSMPHWSHFDILPVLLRSHISQIQVSRIWGARPLGVSRELDDDDDDESGNSLETSLALAVLAIPQVSQIDAKSLFFSEQISQIQDILVVEGEFKDLDKGDPSTAAATAGVCFGKSCGEEFDKGDPSSSW